MVKPTIPNSQRISTIKLCGYKPNLPPKTNLPYPIPKTGLETKSAKPLYVTKSLLEAAKYP